jgi:hypothetical protein
LRPQETFPSLSSAPDLSALPPRQGSSSVDLRPAVFEKGARVGAAILEWGHVRVFSPWDYNVDEAARALLADEGVVAPSGGHLPTGEDLVVHYLEPLSRVPAIAEGLRLGAEVTGITRLGHDLMSNDGRADAPFVVRYRDAGGEHRLLASAVIDASGTWSKPNPMGVDGLSCPAKRRLRTGSPTAFPTSRERSASPMRASASS